MIDQTYSAIGKRKTSIAKVFLKKGSGNITINEKNFKDFFASAVEERELIKTPLLLVKVTNDYDISVIVKGGGISSQLGAIRLAISKSLCEINKSYRPILKQNSLLTRDSRIKERRKYGLRKARKAPQYSKR
jgi:small subunit ribosomal protein S9